jgi:protoporphyrinogen oxidase
MVRRRPKGRQDSFASVLKANLGPTICDSFYFPYARKIWGEDPERLSATQARRRVSANSFSKLLKKLFQSVPGLRPPGAGRFYYPKRGFGQISEAFLAAGKQVGVEALLGWNVTELTPPDSPTARWRVTAERGDERLDLSADYIWSTIPLPVVTRLLTTIVPAEVQSAARAMRFRSMILIYLSLDVPTFTLFDAHYFPGPEVRMTRLSEPKNYAARREPTNRTVLCAELPCSPADPWWDWDDAALGQLVTEDLAEAGIPLQRPPVAVTVRRLPQAYPIYEQGYEKHFDVLDRWADTLPNFLTYGRQGLFAHDNTHHALAMAYAAADCLGPGGFDHSAWSRHRLAFASHVVED